MKIRLIPASETVVIHDPNTGKRVPMSGVMADPRDPFWRRRLVRDRSMVEAPLSKPTRTTEA